MNRITKMSKMIVAVLLIQGVAVVATGTGISTVQERIQAAYEAGTITLDQKMINLYHLITDPQNLKPAFLGTEPLTRLDCASTIIDEIQLNWNRLSADAQSILAPLSYRPDNSSSSYYWGAGVRISVLSNTNFKVHYLDEAHTENSSNASRCSQAYAQGILDAAATAWSHEVGTLGFHAPLVDADYASDYGTDSALWGGDGRVDIYIYDGPWSGATVGEINPEGGYWVGFFMVVPGGYDDGKPTTSHEFFHLIQYYYDRSQGSFWKEATATWMQDEVFHSINSEVVGRVNNFLASPQTSLDDLGGSHEYYACIWPIFLESHRGVGLMRGIWEQASERSGAGTVGDDTYEATERVLGNHSDDTRSAFEVFITKNYNKDFYPDGSNYNRAAVDQDFTLSSSTKTTGEQTVHIDHMASRYFRFLPHSGLPDHSMLRVEAMDMVSVDKRAVVLVRDGTTITEHQAGLGTVIVPDFEDQDEVILVLGNASTTADNTEFKYEARISGGSIAYIIDRSGSMSGTPLANAKLAANQGITTMQTGDEVAVVSFSSSATTNYALHEITDDAIRVAARSAVSSLSAGGMTSIGSGMLEGCDELSRSSAADKDFVLLSDGYQNTPPSPADALASPCFQNLLLGAMDPLSVAAVGRPVHTIAFGSGADQQTLAWIASQTGGVFLYVPDRNDPLALTDLFLTIQGNISGVQRVGSEEGMISAPDIHSFPFTVGPDMMEETVTLVWDDAADDLMLYLAMSDGTIIDAANAAAHGAFFVAGPAIEYLTIPDPMEGGWVAHVQAMSGTADYALVFSGLSSIQMNLSFSRNEYPQGAPINIIASLKEGESPIQGAVVTATVMTPTLVLSQLQSGAPAVEGEGHLDPRLTPDGRSFVDAAGNVLYSATDIALIDDGAHGDGSAGDGIYGGYYADTAVLGTYSFDVVAAGISPSGTDFTRTGRLATVVTQSANADPVADAGEDQTVECEGPTGSAVTLDASGSSDPDGDPLTYTWRSGGNVIAGPTGEPLVTCMFSLGDHVVELTVDDGLGGVATDEVLIAVADGTPPVLTVTASPAVLWPPNHKMVEIEFSVTVGDTCDDAPYWELVDILCNEPDDGTGDGDTPVDFMNAKFGTPDTMISLRAERSGSGTGRVYRAVFLAVDASGNEAVAYASVLVPHSNSERGIVLGDGDYLTSSADEVAFLIPGRSLWGKRTPVHLANGDDPIRTLDPVWATLGNTAGTVQPLAYYLRDIDQDGYNDVLTAFDRLDLLMLQSLSDEEDGPPVMAIELPGRQFIILEIADAQEAGFNLNKMISDLKEEDGITAPTVGAGVTGELPGVVRLTGVVPNPFNPSTTISFFVPGDQRVELTIFDISGRQVVRLLDQVMTSGDHAVVWRGVDDRGGRVASGVYFLRLTTGAVVETARVVMVK